MAPHSAFVLVSSQELHPFRQFGHLKTGLLISCRNVLSVPGTCAFQIKNCSVSVPRLFLQQFLILVTSCYFFFPSVMCVLDTVPEVRDLLMWTFRAYLCLALSHLGVSLGRIKCPFSDHFHVLCETGIQVHLSACAEQLKAVFTCMHCPCTVYLCFLKCCLR